MIRLKSLFLFFVCIVAVAANAGGLLLTPAQLPLAKKYYAELSQKNIPYTLPEVQLKQIDLKPILCEDKAVQKAILGCEKIRCFKKIQLFEIDFLSEFIVLGKDHAGNCEIATVGNKFFVPAKDLKAFYIIGYENAGNLEFEGSVGFDGSSNGITSFEVENKTCKVSVVYKGGGLDLAASNLRPRRPNEKAVEGDAIFKDKGVEYVAANPEYPIQMAYTSKLESYSITPDSPKICTGIATVLLDLEKRGLSVKTVTQKPRALETR